MSKIRVQMPQGTGSVSVAGHSYTADEEGVVHLEHAEHVAPLVSLGGLELNEDDQPGTVSALMGSSTLPATIELGEGRDPVSLGDLVRETHARTEISVDEWNNLPPRVRDILLGFRLAEMSGRLGDAVSLQERLDTAERALDQANSRIAELTRQDTGQQHGGGEQQPQTPERPTFADMTKAKINEWLEANGGQPIASGDHPSHVAAAEARWVELHPEA